MIVIQIFKLCDFGSGEYPTSIKHKVKYTTLIFSPPEIFNTKFIDLYKRDIWGLGLIIYTLYIGFPYKEYDSSINDILEITQFCPNYTKCDDNLLIDLLKNILILPQNRYYIWDIIKHPWVKKKRLFCIN